MTRDVLQRLGIHAGFVEHCQIAVAEDGGGRAVQINGFANLLEHALMRRSRDGRLLFADDIAGFLGRSEHLDELCIEWKAAKAVACLGRGHLSLIVGVGRVPPHRDEARLEIQILPAQTEHLAPAHSREEQQRHQPAFHERKRADLRDDLRDHLRGQRFANHGVGFAVLHLDVLALYRISREGDVLIVHRVIEKIAEHDLLRAFAAERLLHFGEKTVDLSVFDIQSDDRVVKLTFAVAARPLDDFMSLFVDTQIDSFSVG